MRVLAIAAALAALQFGTSAEGHPISGKIRDGVYTNPAGTFRLSVPALAGPAVRVVDGAPEPGVWQVQFSDDRCRTFTAAEHRNAVPGAAFDAWLDNVVMSGIRADGGEDVTLRRVASPFGETALIAYWKPASAPCRVYDKVVAEDRLPMRMGSRGGTPLRDEDAIREAGWTIWRPTAQVVLQIIAAGERTFSLYYVVGQGVTAQTDWIGPPSLPPEAALAAFVTGLDPAP